nr:PREDICTED: complexin-1 [Bos mutus]
MGHAVFAPHLRVGAPSCPPLVAVTLLLEQAPVLRVPANARCFLGRQSVKKCLKPHAPGTPDTGQRACVAVLPRWSLVSCRLLGPRLKQTVQSAAMGSGSPGRDVACWEEHTGSSWQLSQCCSWRLLMAVPVVAPVAALVVAPVCCCSWGLLRWLPWPALMGAPVVGLVVLFLAAPVAALWQLLVVAARGDSRGGFFKAWIWEARAAALHLGLECDCVGQLTCKRCQGGMRALREGRIGATGREHREGPASVLACLTTVAKTSPELQWGQGQFAWCAELSAQLVLRATKDMGKMLGGDEEKDPDAAKKEEERQEALRQEEEERKAKYAKMEAEREAVRQGIRDKVGAAARSGREAEAQAALEANSEGSLTRPKKAIPPGCGDAAEEEDESILDTVIKYLPGPLQDIFKK